MSCDKSLSWLLLKSLLEKKIDTTLLNTYGFQNSWQIPLSRDYKPLLSLSEVCSTFAQIFHFMCPFFFTYYVDQAIKLMRMKKWEYDSAVVKWTTFPAKYVYDFKVYEPMIFNHFFFRNNLTVNDIMQNAVTWKCLKGFVTYFSVNNNKTTIYKKRHLVVNSSRFTHQTVLLKVVRCTPKMDKLHYCSSQWDGINTVRPTFSQLCLTFTAIFEQ